MNEYIKQRPLDPSFSQEGFNGYKYNLINKQLDINYYDVFKGHDKYCSNKKSTHFYYILSGEGTFKIEETIYEVKTNDLVEIPPNTSFVFAGSMKVLAIMNPPFDPDNSIAGKDNDLY